MGFTRDCSQGGCSPICSPTVPDTLLSDVWVLRRPEDGGLGWKGLATGLASRSSASSDNNLWKRMHQKFTTDGQGNPGKRFFDSLVAESDSSAILYGGIVSRSNRQPSFNYEVKCGCRIREGATTPYPVVCCFRSSPSVVLDFSP